MVALSYCEVVTYAVLAVCRKTHYRGSFKKKKTFAEGQKVTVPETEFRLQCEQPKKKEIR